MQYFAVRFFIAILTFSLGLAANWGFGSHKEQRFATYHSCHRHGGDIPAQVETGSDSELPPCKAILPTYPGKCADNDLDENGTPVKTPGHYHGRWARAH